MICLIFATARCDKTFFYYTKDTTRHDNTTMTLTTRCGRHLQKKSVKYMSSVLENFNGSSWALYVGMIKTLKIKGAHVFVVLKLFGL